MLFIGGSLPKLTFVDDDTKSVTSGSTITFEGMNFGDDASDRYIAAVLGYVDTPSSVAIGAVTPALIVEGSRINGNFVARCAIMIAKVPSGASGDVVLTFPSGGSRNVGCSLYRMTGLANGGAASDTDTDNSSHFPMSANVSLPSKGVSIAGAYVTESGATPPMDWTGPMTTDVNTRFGIAGGIGTGFSSLNYTGGAGDVTITATLQTDWRVAALAAASFR